MRTSQLLVIEDDTDIRDGLCNLLKDEGYDPVAVHNGNDAIELLKRNDFKPCVILLDMSLPGMDGWDFLEERRKLSDEQSKVPVVVVSASKVTIRHSDMTEIVSKPIAIDDLLKAVRKFCVQTAQSSV